MIAPSAREDRVEPSWPTVGLENLVAARSIVPGSNPATVAVEPAAIFWLGYPQTAKQSPKIASSLWGLYLLDSVRWSEVTSHLSALVFSEALEQAEWTRQSRSSGLLHLVVRQGTARLEPVIRTRETVFFTWWTRSVASLDRPSSLGLSEEELLLEITGRFSKHEQVQAIYHQRYRDENQITVAIDTPAYDPDLMDKLLDEEYEVRQRAGERVLTFSYPPTGVVERREVVHPKARLLYLRQALQWPTSPFI